MCIIGAVACLLPMGFLALCTWVVMIEVPRRQSHSDLSFLRAWSFLFIRFRPGLQVVSVLFLARNALVVLCQLLASESAKIVVLNLMLYMSLRLGKWQPQFFMFKNSDLYMKFRFCEIRKLIRSLRNGGDRWTWPDKPGFFHRLYLGVLSLSTHKEPTNFLMFFWKSRILTAYSKPWRFMLCNWLDIWLLTGLMVIVDMGAVTMRESGRTAMIISAVARTKVSVNKKRTGSSYIYLGCVFMKLNIVFLPQTALELSGVSILPRNSLCSIMVSGSR